MIIAWMGLLAAISVGFVIWPLVRKNNKPLVIEDTTPAVLVDQLDEVQRDLDRNLISKTEANAAQLEIKRRMLTAARRGAPGRIADGGTGRGLLWSSALFVPAAAIAYYALMGSPEISSLAYADRQAERAERQKIVEITDKLYARLTSEPDGGASEGWMLLGQTYYRMGDFDRAVEAFETVAERADATSATYSMLAEALVSAEQGIVTPKAETAIDRAVVLDPSNPAGIFYKSLALSQRGEEPAAHDLLVSQLDTADGFAPWMEAFVAQANSIGEKLGRDRVSLTDYAPVVADAPGPTEEDVAAAEEMSGQDRAEFIRSMVGRLATRLQNAPDDLDGWLRLGNAYTVLGETDQAIEALKMAEKLLASLSSDDPRHKLVDQALSELQE
ncbi:c-type cytochrome biogenesis protein CcmI [Aliiroseovarius sp. KMU-50]|uniref:C-type cytochrome biogenesis protein CcmI n=1 Tax=Aliiroseovarius salicola TaxID=3009082 RepID=A0ABT4W5I3_9RHOB|nr:c-type cytochrome biogenesis protein CcmI [Aliiroseovarius sp. KMU-50]MDA5095775.1 c-type cytochrome biogenesis protein CcmI [Aliiroseovarius sp. KMU-50]